MRIVSVTASLACCGIAAAASLSMSVAVNPALAAKVGHELQLGLKPTLQA